MRLINVNTLKLREFYGEPGRDMPPYAILSHTWGADEITFQEFSRGVEEDRRWTAGYEKIVNCCSEAKSHNIQWAWIDTCCIDKSSSAELSEAINSMFHWYAKSKICYAYLSDIRGPGPLSGDDVMNIMDSRWFTRGWTLQELLAPQDVCFFDSTWNSIGTKSDLKNIVARAARISVEAVGDTHRDLEQYSVAERLGWAAHRRTTRVEDEAYCLLGLFGVNMPLLYGEGRRAFIRLQEEIIRRTPDQSIYAWTLPPPLHMKQSGLLAPSPRYFRLSSPIEAAVGGRNVDSVLPSLTAVRDHLGTWFKGYMSPFRVSGNILEIEQPALGPIRRMYLDMPPSKVIPSARLFRFEIPPIEEMPLEPYVTALHLGENNRLEVAHESTAILPQRLRGSERKAPGWQSFEKQRVYLVPLLCSIAGRAMCLLISQPAPEAPSDEIPRRSLDRAFLRQHSPSLVSLHPSFLKLIQPKNTLHAYAHQREDFAFQDMADPKNATTPNTGSPWAPVFLIQPSTRGGYPQVELTSLLRAGYYAFSYHILPDGSEVPLSELEETTSSSKQITTFIQSHMLKSGDRRLELPGQVIEPRQHLNGRYVGLHITCSFSIGLYDDSIAVAFFEKGREPLIGGSELMTLEDPEHFGSARDVADGMESNPFIGMPGLLATEVFDVWTLDRADVLSRDKVAVMLRSRATEKLRILEPSIDFAELIRVAAGRFRGRLRK